MRLKDKHKLFISGASLLSIILVGVILRICNGADARTEIMKGIIVAPIACGSIYLIYGIARLWIKK